MLMRSLMAKRILYLDREWPFVIADIPIECFMNPVATCSSIESEPLGTERIRFKDYE